MRVLIVTKTTNYELHGPAVEARVQAGRVSPDALARLMKAHSEHYATLSRLKDAMEKAKVDYDLVSREDDGGRGIKYEAVLTVGGDGTLLSASHHIADGMPIYGVRSSESSVGYLCCAGPDDPEALVKALLAKRARFVSVNRLVCVVKHADFAGSSAETRTVPILNDFLYTNANPAATTRYRIHFRGETELHRSSGIWVATGVGSTAAILAAGGAPRPKDDVFFQFKIRELYRLARPQPMIDGGLFDPSVESVVIENRCPLALLALDGQHGSLDLKYGDTLRFERGPSLALALPIVS